jgi:hypothetical protein
MKDKHLRLALLLLIAAGCAHAPPPAPVQEAGALGSWVELGPTLQAWSGKDGGDRGGWTEAGGVALAGDPAQLALQPGSGVLVNGNGRTVNLFSRLEHGDVEAHVEFLVPRGSNSGVYLQGRYEVQIFDSHGVAEPKHSDCGGIYQRWREAEKKGFEGRPPRVNASRPAGEWQTFDVVFRAPRFDGSGRKIENARFVRVVHNGVLVHENAEVTGPTRAAAWEDERATGPLKLQGDHGPVAYRNVRIRKIEKVDPGTGAPLSGGR